MHVRVMEDPRSIISLQPLIAINLISGSKFRILFPAINCSRGAVVEGEREREREREREADRQADRQRDSEVVTDK